MAKFIFTESQLKSIKKQINEGAMANDRYSNKVSVDVETYGVKVNGDDIDWADCGDVTLNYIISVEHRSWGLKNISLYDINGPSEFEIEITPQTEDSENVYLNLTCDWDNVEREEEEGEGLITIGNQITIKLANNENGEIYIESVRVPVYTL